MSSPSSPATPTTPGSPRHFRAKLRHATWVDPQTATKSKRTFSLTPVSANNNGNLDGSASPLLSPETPDEAS
ncbi:hypothetical protein LTR05_007083 [Lithohypha guttulata]|uniref:Uncharacterized protein n=1 Tax=Lithohypha guttulata TaxID=1690604 RepID=A0AAN7Y9J0_9EURO|nr:hypothetical protein LTR05_007083 [Lithohypha guttulata]